MGDLLGEIEIFPPVGVGDGCPGAKDGCDAGLGGGLTDPGKVVSFFVCCQRFSIDGYGFRRDLGYPVHNADLVEAEGGHISFFDPEAAFAVSRTLALGQRLTVVFIRAWDAAV